MIDDYNQKHVQPNENGGFQFMQQINEECQNSQENKQLFQDLDGYITLMELNEQKDEEQQLVILQQQIKLEQQEKEIQRLEESIVALKEKYMQEMSSKIAEFQQLNKTVLELLDKKQNHPNLLSIIQQQCADLKQMQIAQANTIKEHAQSQILIDSLQNEVADKGRLINVLQNDILKEFEQMKQNRNVEYRRDLEQEVANLKLLIESLQGELVEERQRVNDEIQRKDMELQLLRINQATLLTGMSRDSHLHQNSIANQNYKQQTTRAKTVADAKSELERQATEQQQNQYPNVQRFNAKADSIDRVAENVLQSINLNLNSNDDNGSCCQITNEKRATDGGVANLINNFGQNFDYSLHAQKTVSPPNIFIAEADLHGLNGLNGRQNIQNVQKVVQKKIIPKAQQRKQVKFDNEMLNLLGQNIGDEGNGKKKQATRKQRIKKGNATKTTNYNGNGIEVTQAILQSFI